MKHLLFLPIFCLSIANNLSAQVHPHALGIRGGSGNYGAGAELSYQLGLGESNRLEFDLGYKGNNGQGLGSHNGYKLIVLSGIYHWDWNIFTEGLNWYVGPGAQVGQWRWNNSLDGEGGLIFAVGGQIGLEYDFSVHEVPLLLAIDSRPMWNFFTYYNNAFGYNWALSLRWIFD